MKTQAEAQKTQAEMQQEIQKYQAETQMQMQIEQMKAEAKRLEIQASLELQAANDQRDAEREQMKAQFDAAMEQQRLEFEKWKAELDARVKLRVANIGNENGDQLLAEISDAQAMGDTSPINQIMMMQAQTAEAINQLAQHLNKPKQIVRDASGRAVGVQSVEVNNG